MKKLMIITGLTAGLLTGCQKNQPANTDDIQYEVHSDIQTGGINNGRKFFYVSGNREFIDTTATFDSLQAARSCAQLIKQSN